MYSSYRIYLIFALVQLFLYFNLSECNVIHPAQKDYQEGDRFVYIPDGVDNIKMVDLQEPVNERYTSIDITSLVTFNLFTRDNPDEPQILQNGDEDGFMKSYFNINKTTVFLNHGWLSSAMDMKDLADAFLADDDVNVVNLDWNPIAQESYTTAKGKAAEIGEAIGDFVNWLVTYGVSYNGVHLAGISLGAQILANAGRQTNGQVRKITALDPAGPLWYTDRQRLQPTDAQFVEVIHTNTVLYGYRYPCGHVDIYPDGGAIVPACLSNPLDPLTDSVCSHVISHDFFLVSIRYPDHFIAKECKSFTEATSQPCDGQPFVFGTSDLTKTGTGIYRMETKATYPY